jgi:hypothetical protein
MQSMIGNALALAARGMCIFPCVPRDKQPATEHGCKDATTDAEIIRRWWRQQPECNIAIATGAPSKVFAVDVDGLEAEGELRRLEAEHGELPATIETITLRGRHVYFRMPERSVRNSAGKIAPGIDARGDGGYCLAPPSIHPTGRRYCWSVDCAKAFAEAPAWLLQRVAEPADKKKTPAPPSEWQALIARSVDEGSRNSVAARLSGYFLRHHINAAVVHDLMQLWNEARCRPPLPAEDIETIVASIAGLEMKRRYGVDG